MEGHSMRGEGCILRTRMVLLRDVFPSRNQITLWDKPTRRSEKYLVCLEAKIRCGAAVMKYLKSNR